MDYLELKKKHATELADTPLFYAFTGEHLTKALGKIKADQKDIVSLGGGAFIHKDDVDGLMALIKRHKTTMAAAMEDDAFLIQASIYELGNHEYCYTYDTANTIAALGLDLEDERVSKLFRTAVTEYWAGCDI